MWGPFGGYRAAILLRAMAASEPAAAAGELHVYVPRDRQARAGGDRRRVAAGEANWAHALTAAMTQDGAPIMDAGAWFVAEGMAGFEHDVATMPTVPPAAALRGFQDLADNYSEWYPLWRNVEGRPLVWNQAIGPPIYQIWLRLLQPLPADDRVLEAARQLMWLDVIMWNAVPPPHGYHRSTWPRASTSPPSSTAAIPRRNGSSATPPRRSLVAASPPVTAASGRRQANCSRAARRICSAVRIPKRRDSPQRAQSALCSSVSSVVRHAVAHESAVHPHCRADCRVVAVVGRARRRVAEGGPRDRQARLHLRRPDGGRVADDVRLLPRYRRSAVSRAVQHHPQHRARLHPRRYGVRHAQLGHAVLVRRARSARRTDGAHGPEDRRPPLLRLPADGSLHFQLRLCRQPRHRQRRRALPDRRAPLAREDAGGHRRGDRGGDRPRHRRRPHTALQSGRPRPREGDPGRVPRRPALDLSGHAATGAAGRAMAEADAGGGGAHVLEFFNQLAFLLQFAEPPHRSEIRLRDSFAKIGIVPGKPFDAAALSPALQEALTQGMADGQKESTRAARRCTGAPISSSARARSSRTISSRAQPARRWASAPTRAKRRCTRSTTGTRTGSRSTAATHLHAAVRQGAFPAGACILVADDVRPPAPAPREEPAQPLSHQLARCCRP